MNFKMATPGRKRGATNQLLRWIWTCIGIVAGMVLTHAAPIVVSSIPSTGATGVSVAAPVVFTFNEPIDTTRATILLVAGSSLPSTINTWSAGNTVLTCTPSPDFPPNKFIQWLCDVYNTSGVRGGGAGSFTTGAAIPVGSGFGTNHFNTFRVGESILYAQTSATDIVPDSTRPYSFVASATLASNVTATAISLNLPTGTTLNFQQNAETPESYFPAITQTKDYGIFTDTYPAGAYVYNVASTAIPSPVTVTLSSLDNQPPPPKVANFAAAQAMDPTQPFTLQWDPWPGATAEDFIQVIVGNSFQTPSSLYTGGLNGTVTSAIIPPTSTEAVISFYRYTTVTNGLNISFQYRATATHFPIKAGAISVPQLGFSRAFFTSQGFVLELTAPLNQGVYIEYKSDLTSLTWQNLAFTNTTTSPFQILDPDALANPLRYYRARIQP